MMRIAIIPARGGSKRLPRKNIVPIMGKAALSYPVEAAFKSGLFDRVIVSTEDDEIRKTARNFGAETVSRPQELSGDTVGVVDVCLDVIEQLKGEDCFPDYFCCVYATAVFLRPEDFIQSYRIVEQQPDVKVVMGVSGYNLQPAQAMTFENGLLKPCWPELLSLQSQAVGRRVASNGTLYWAETRTFLEQKTFYVDHLAGYEIPWIRAIDMDTPEDLKIVRLLAPLILPPEK